MKAARRSEQNYFPEAGPVLQYRPFIIKQARWYSRKYFTDFFATLQEAVHLAHRAEQKFDPARGSFSTLLQWELHRLHRYCQREYRFRHARQPRKSELEDWEQENKRAKQVRNRTQKVCWHGDRHDYLEAVDLTIGRAARVGVVLGRERFARGKPRNYKRWKPPRA